MASLDLSMAFDMVNTNLLVKRLKVMGMPNDIIKLIKEWLLGSKFGEEVVLRASFNDIIHVMMTNCLLQ